MTTDAKPSVALFGEKGITISSREIQISSKESALRKRHTDMVGVKTLRMDPVFAVFTVFL
jgi:hypothetical protein